MIDIEKLKEYLPKKHGEHGVDSILHRLIKREKRLHEVFCNPPGGSWTQFDILRPKTDLMYRWDHIPRVPAKAKRPDLVIQMNDDDMMNFILIESKKSINEIYEDMSKLLIRFFTGSPGYVGIMNRPPWHQTNVKSPSWEVVKPEHNDEDRYWFKNYSKDKIHFWTGFSFAFNPEKYIRAEDFDKEENLEKMKDILKSNDLDVVIGCGWHGKHEYPFLLKMFSEDFKKTKLCTILKESISSIDLSPI